MTDQYHDVVHLWPRIGGDVQDVGEPPAQSLPVTIQGQEWAVSDSNGGAESVGTHFHTASATTTLPGGNPALATSDMIEVGGYDGSH